MSKVCWGNDWPSFVPLEDLYNKFVTMNEEAGATGLPPFSEREMALMLGESFLLFAGVEDW